MFWRESSGGEGAPSSVPPTHPPTHPPRAVSIPTLPHNTHPTPTHPPTHPPTSLPMVFWRGSAVLPPSRPPTHPPKPYPTQPNPNHPPAYTTHSIRAQFNKSSMSTALKQTTSDLLTSKMRWNPALGIMSTGRWVGGWVGGWEMSQRPKRRSFIHSSTQPTPTKNSVYLHLPDRQLHLLPLPRARHRLQGPHGTSSFHPPTHLFFQAYPPTHPPI